MPELHKAIARLMADRRPEPGAPYDSPPFRAVLDLVCDQVSPDEQRLVANFIRGLFAREGASLLTSLEPAHLAGMAVHIFRFLCARGRRLVALRTYVPVFERDGWTSSNTVVEAVLLDRPFIVDTLLESIQQRGGEIRLVLHPILGVRRSPTGQVVDIGPASGTEDHEACVHIEATRIQPDVALTELLTDRIESVARATDDYPAMRQRVAALAAELHKPGLSHPWREDADEAAAFLDWLGHKCFVYLGYRDFEIESNDPLGRLRPRPGSGLGILRDDSAHRYDDPQGLEPDACRKLNEPPLLVVSKSRMTSPIHRLVPMDCLALKQVGPKGTVVGERRLLGLFTSRAYHEPSSTVPILRGKLQAVMAQEAVIEDSHDYRNLVDLFDSFPKQELLASTVHDIRAALRVVLAAEGSSSVRVIAHWDANRRGMFVIVIVPRTRFSTELSERVGVAVRSRLQATVLDEQVILDEREEARLHYHLLAAPATLDGPVSEILEHDLNVLLRTWDDRLRYQLGGTYSAVEADRLADYYNAGFPTAYKARTSIEEAIADIRSLERLVATGVAQIECDGADRKGAGVSALKLYLARERVVLSDFIPVLENLGLRVLDEQFVDLSLPKVEQVRIHTFEVEDATDARRPLVERAPFLISALHALRAGRIDNDPLNKLILRANLDWRTVDLLRAYAEYARQIRVAAGETPLFEALTGHPEPARLLVAMFAAKFDPAAAPLPAPARVAGPVAEAQAAFLHSLEGVASLVHDRILRALGAAVAATVRTNFYDPSMQDSPAEAIAIKIDCRQLPQVPEPRPMFETYIHGARVEGVHLRAGLVARGGIRFSDRPDDFRSEVLSLMKTQSVKNAVIVPVGAKGGFVLKGRHAAGAPEAAEVELAYRAFISALLSVTDNVRDGLVVPPAGQITYDGPDPYLVVAADKGTATLSDTANAIAILREFWLGDAFASGGGHGYDHKKIGITARGGWECVRYHFHAMGRDVNREPVTVLGIGDMSGDVFGNGMLLSRTIRLRAAFDHRNIFLDPDPDPEVSYTERERLFRLARSSWQDYDPAVLSAGGGVFPRNAKSVPLSPEARAMLGIDETAPPGEEVVGAILRMDADLLWNGGIGTYVKASDESDAEVRDPTNDAVRVCASELRVKVVGEGGNLGFTQRARVEFALAGGRINTDAIDNSGGVDMSDHEVNLKIALAPAVAARELSLEERDRLLAEIAGEVTEAVLKHNRRQALVLGLDQRRSSADLAGFLEHSVLLEAEGQLDRRAECVPAAESVRTRRARFLGLTRPELAVLLAHTKLDLQRRLMASALCDDPEVGPFFALYFPETVRTRFATLLSRHPLRREITAVELANRVIDGMGITFLTRLASQTGHDTVEIVRAWVAAAEISGAVSLLEELEAIEPPLAAEAEAECHFALGRALERATKWVLDTQPSPFSMTDIRERFGQPVQLLLSAWPELLDGEASVQHGSALSRLTKLGVAEVLAARLTAIESIQDAFEIALVAGEFEVPLPAATEAYLGLTGMVDVDWVRRSLDSLAGSEDRWEQRAVEGLLEGLMYARRQLAREVLAFHEQGQTDLAACLASYADQHRGQLDRLNRVINDLKALPQFDVARILVVMRELGRLLGRT
jgi:glutamate dehydrogenase